ncbi:hypothetical protein SAMD00019534_090320 [Acytostelium subglobosum LB1]|uniref:hypothetical protein n=1 Tax=Acytostelium subglobosum LB1 TaxID=1410327 RepID=UPI0006451E4B|nr:hypothetical protein SAMD00019534_090320 [Acytostelium subglobosum LB1]GAM25857.1 hypothetical protein SAMD00019534_090320 [Acytostelium subglobosum LB1]|eukprot:XP_012751375.1 hypothetical protein SAMD00019534_090320 [Acytostelium subglobosum LB1]
MKRYPEYVHLITNQEVKDIKYDEVSRLSTLTIQDKSSMSTISIKTDYLIGADGSSSMVRKWMSTPFTGHSGHLKWLVVDAVLGPKHPPLPHYMQFVNDPSRPKLSLPIPHNRYRWEFVLFPDEDEKDMVSLDKVTSLITKCGADMEHLDIVRKSIYGVQNRIAHQWYNNENTMLIGDAAHCVPPFLGLGISSGMRDSMNLAWKINLCLKGVAPPRHLLNTYMEERKPDVVQISERSTNAGHIIMTHNRVVALIRDIILFFLLLIPFVKALAMSSGMKPSTNFASGFKHPRKSKTWRSHLGSLMYGDFNGHLIAQPRVVHGERVKLLDEILGLGFSVLLFNFNRKDGTVCDSAAVMLDQLKVDDMLWKKLSTSFVQVVKPNIHALHWTRLHPSCNIVEDIDDHLDQYSRGSTPMVIVVRPDKYIYGVFHGDEIEQAFQSLSDAITSGSSTTSLLVN